MTRPRPLTGDERRRLTLDLRALADELDRPDAGRTQQNLGVALDSGYSATASGAGAGGGGGVGLMEDTVVEARADRRDPTASSTELLLAALRRLLSDVGYAYDGLAGWRGDRPVSCCPEGHVIDRGSSRCQWVDPETGRRCGTRRETILTCGNPNHTNLDGAPVKLLPGERRWKSVALDLGGIEISECAKCRMYRRRTGRSWAPATRLDVAALGAYHSDEEPWADGLPSAG